MATWFSVATPEEESRLLSAWSDAPIENAELIGMLLDVAKEQVLSFAPALTDAEPGTYEAWPMLVDGVEIGYVWVFQTVPTDAPDIDAEPLPSRYVYAQLQQAKNLWNAGRTDGSGDAGSEGYSFTPRPLDKVIRQIIRPMSGAADVF